VLVTTGAIIPSAVGVDIGCGMIAVRTDLERASIGKRAEHLLLGYLREAIPNGVAQNHRTPTEAARRWYYAHRNTNLGEALEARALLQFGTLGSGNHFAEFSRDEEGAVWAIVHSGSRGVGLQLATRHIEAAKATCPVQVEDHDLAFLVSGSSSCASYIEDMQWAQAYAYAQREAMMDVMLEALAKTLGHESDERSRVNCHHNYAVPFDEEGGEWLIRKGAIDAHTGVYGVIPGSMGTDTYIVTGLGNEQSYWSSPHGAGRMHSRGAARRTLSVESLKALMGDRTWDDRNAQALLDESPEAYKPIEVVMRDAAELVAPVARLEQFVNFKAADPPRGRRFR
jgi:tRNA-splicing ligase RtcB